MSFHKMITSHNKEGYIKTLTDALDRFITFSDRFGISREKSFEKFKAGEEMDFEMIAYYEYGYMARHLRDNLEEICLHVHAFSFSPDQIGETIYPEPMIKSLYRYRQFCYGNRHLEPENNFMTLEEQNEQTKNYVHFDFGVKKPKTLKDI